MSDDKKIEVWIDTNVIVYALRTNSEFSPQVQQLIREAGKGSYVLKVSPVVIGECVFVLMGRQFNRTKNEVQQALTSFINLKGVEAEEKEVIEKALLNFTKKGIDFQDAYIAAHAEAVTPAHVISVNVKDFKRLGILVETPEQIITGTQHK